GLARVLARLLRRPRGTARRGQRGGGRRLVLQLRARLRGPRHPRRLGADHAGGGAAGPAGRRGRGPQQAAGRAGGGGGRSGRPAVAGHRRARLLRSRAGRGERRVAGFAGEVVAASSASSASSAAAGLGRLWQAATLLREHRGDGHFAALAAADIDGCEAVVLRCCLDLRREDMQPVRGWTDEAWDSAVSRLAARGWVGADGALTSAGREAPAAVEAATDRAASRPWARLGPE